jgi:hypothetical protein
MDDPRLRVSELRVNCASSGDSDDNALPAKYKMTGIQIANNG